MTAVVFKRGSSDETWPTSLMDSCIFSVRSRSCSNGRWSCRTDALKADLIKEESWQQQQPSIAHVASHYFGLDNLLLEGVADRDWGIASAMAMVVAIGKSCFWIFFLQIMSSLIHFTLTRFWDPRHTNRAVDCSRREPKKRSKILYLGTVRINIPKIKYSALSFVHTFL